MRHRKVDLATRSALEGVVACVLAAIVSAYVGHYGIALLAVGCAVLAARQLRLPSFALRRVPRLPRLRLTR